MGYTRTYRETVSKTVYGSKTVSYPASERGGSTSVSYQEVVSIPVDVEIFVDTSPFDQSVSTCEKHVDVLTGAIVATEKAEINAIAENSNRIADTIIGGFFGYIKSEISQQISELAQKLDSQLMYLKDVSQNCVAKKDQMQKDYHRISGRYVKIFEELNSELTNRILELDRPTFDLKREMSKQSLRYEESDTQSTALIFGKESNVIQSQILASTIKKRALDALNKSRLFLKQQADLNRTVKQSMHNENIECSHYAPVCYLESTKGTGAKTAVVYTPTGLEAIDKTMKDKMIQRFGGANFKWKSLSPEYQKGIQMYFNLELNKSIKGTSNRDLRVKEMVQRMANFGAIQSASTK